MGDGKFPKRVAVGAAFFCFAGLVRFADVLAVGNADYAGLPWVNVLIGAGIIAACAFFFAKRTLASYKVLQAVFFVLAAALVIFYYANKKAFEEAPFVAILFLLFSAVPMIVAYQAGFTKKAAGRFKHWAGADKLVPAAVLDDPDATWKCPKCAAENRNTGFTCAGCGYSLK